jgi:hypothetical protein
MCESGRLIKQEAEEAVEASWIIILRESDLT